MTTLSAKQIEAARWRAFGQFLKAKRDEARLTQGASAERADIDRQTWYRTEAGQPTTYATVIGMAQALGGSIKEFVEAAGFKYQPGGTDPAPEPRAPRTRRARAEKTAVIFERLANQYVRLPADVQAKLDTLAEAAELLAKDKD